MSTTFADPRTLDRTTLEQGGVFAPKFDSQGLLAAIAVDARTREVLMLGHMNAEALSRTLETGEVHYYSRSRGRLWKKGESSGQIQKLVEIRPDCDQDALVVLVEQTGHGAACHTGRRSCFYRRVTADGTLADAGVPQLFDPRQVYPQ